MTQGELTSQIVNTIKSLNKDNHTSRRYILSVARENAKQLISQKLLDRTIGQEANLYTKIECVDFKAVEKRKCPLVEFSLCNILMRSVKPLPELVFSRLGASIRFIHTLDYQNEFKVLDSKQYLRNKKRAHSISSDRYLYLGSDNHLYIPDYEIYSLDLELLTTKPDEVECGCKNDECKSGWDYPFIIPDKLISTVLDKTLQTLGFTKQIQADPNPNGVENG